MQPDWLQPGGAAAIDEGDCNPHNRMHLRRITNFLNESVETKIVPGTGREPDVGNRIIGLRER
eukprot:5221903-Pleurochrysis_carterae.AAC.3